MIYVGQVGAGNQKLLGRLRKHRRDQLAGRWDRFSWFGLQRVLADGKLSVVSQRSSAPRSVTLNQMEAILIAAAEPELNRQGGRFGKDAKRYLQRRDDRLAPTQAQMIEEIWEKTKALDLFE